MNTSAETTQSSAALSLLMVVCDHQLARGELISFGLSDYTRANLGFEKPSTLVICDLEPSTRAGPVVDVYVRRRVPIFTGEEERVDAEEVRPGVFRVTLPVEDDQNLFDGGDQRNRWVLVLERAPK
jgi:hypothetical protein